MVHSCLDFDLLTQHCHDRGPCSWQSREGVWFDLDELLNRLFQVGLPSPKGAVLKFHLCSSPSPQVTCRNGVPTLACITVPGVKPTSTGKRLRIEQLEPNIPSMGIRLVYEDGETCEVTKKPRRTTIRLPCSREADYSAQSLHPRQAWEGKGTEICHYYVEFPASKFGCPVDDSMSHTLASTLSQHMGEGSDGSGDADTHHPRPRPEILAVTGCQDSEPARTTADCHFAGKIHLVLHGVNFNSLCASEGLSSASSMSTGCVESFGSVFSVLVGKTECRHVALVSQYQINCTLEKGSGSDLDVTIRKRQVLLSERSGEEEEEEEEVAVLRKAVSFKERVNYKERFGKFVEMGVGGMKREINELYRRAFASRGKSIVLSCMHAEPGMH